MSKKEDLLTYELASHLLSYDPNSGILVWRVKRSKSRAGTIAGHVEKASGYVRIEVNYVMYAAHRIAWLLSHGEWPKGVIDHINSVPADNRLANLRDVSSSLNAQNRKKASTRSKSGFLGVSKTESGLYACQILDPANKKALYLGSFTTAEGAHAAYLAKKRELHPGCTI